MEILFKKGRAYEGKTILFSQIIIKSNGKSISYPAGLLFQELLAFLLILTIVFDGPAIHVDKVTVNKR